MAKIEIKKTRCPACNSARTHMRTKKSFGIMCYNCGKFTSKSSNKCPSCGGLVKNGECKVCHAKKFQETFVFEEKEGKKIEDRADQADQQVDQADQAGQGSYVCECGEKIVVKENIKRSIWDSVEWIVCPACGNRRKREGVNNG